MDEKGVERTLMEEGFDTEMIINLRQILTDLKLFWNKSFDNEKIKKNWQIIQLLGMLLIFKI